jgi:hypothetical protein
VQAQPTAFDVENNMTRILTRARDLIRAFIALTLLACTLVMPLAPLVQAALSPEACSCCHGASKCVHHSTPSTTPILNTGSGCADHCLASPGFLPSTQSAMIADNRLRLFTPLDDGIVSTAVVACRNPAYSLARHQRPPPAN